MTARPFVPLPTLAPGSGDEFDIDARLAGKVALFRMWRKATEDVAGGRELDRMAPMCVGCPFRDDSPVGDERQVAGAMVRSLANEDHIFACHETAGTATDGTQREYDPAKSRPCGGWVRAKVGMTEWIKGSGA